MCSARVTVLYRYGINIAHINPSTVATIVLSRAWANNSHPSCTRQPPHCFLDPLKLLPKTVPSVGTFAVMSLNPPETPSRSKYQAIFYNALAAYKNKTGKDLTSDPLLGRLKSCDSPGSVIDLLREQIPGFGGFERKNDRLTRWLNPTVYVLYSLSSTIGGPLSLVSLGKFKLLHRSSALLYLISRCAHQRGQSLRPLAPFSR
jgi:hypothetical protein